MIERIRAAKGVSCVEIYLSALLSLHGIDERCLFTDSYIDLQETLNDFLDKRLSYASYSGKPRLQTSAKNMGLIALQSFKRGTATREFGHILYEVSPSYKKGGAFAPWREDHYLLWYGGDFYDCYPPARLSVREVFDSLADTCIGIDVLPDAAPPNKEECVRALMKTIPAESENLRLELTPENLIYARDALLYVKVMRERMNALLENGALESQIGAIAKLIARIELYRQRKTIGMYRNLVDEIDEKEKLWKREILNG